MTRYVALTLSILLLPLMAAGGRRTPDRMLQATEAQRGWVAAIDQRRARLQAPDGARQSFRVRRGERWLSLSEFANGWIAAGVRLGKSGVDLSLVANFGHGARRLRQPAQEERSIRTRPTPIVSPSGLHGIAWLEGDSPTRLAVRAAAFEEGSFDAVATVSPAGVGGQAGLSAAVLADGSWLLVWSRFDGRDDEIFWSKRSPEGRWSRARRLAANNSVPDITPWLLPHGDGALVAWSRMTDEYEVVTARFANGGWTSPRPLGGQGTLSPTFRRLRDRDLLLVRNAWPAAWTAFSFDQNGEPTEFAVVPEESGRPPVVRAGGGSSLAFEWPGRRARTPLLWEPVQ